MKNNLLPIGTARTKDELEFLLRSEEIRQINIKEQALLADNSLNQNSIFHISGFCLPCNKTSDFLVDMNFGGHLVNHCWIPNWRERLVCGSCMLNNRQRLIASLVGLVLSNSSGYHVYFMEQVTPIFTWARDKFGLNHHIVGSEYLGFEYESGQKIGDLRHEDIEKSSFASNSVDLIVSNEVLEHVPHPVTAFSECARILKPGGTMLMTMPFCRDKDKTVRRARLENGTLLHDLPPVYHGNPISSEGSLVFSDFGWDILNEIESVGFEEVNLEIYASSLFGHFGGGQIIFRLKK